ncbi:MAG: methyltransferase domain-containing protein [Candidatus Verstraetearchaeota archaeon]|nr:methyltransferase domain-containing protein [Candidatus Verstraetearchaeota archaeon]
MMLMENFFLRLSCEHPSLPMAEVKAILEAERIPYTLNTSLPCVFRFSSSKESIRTILKRSSMAFFGARELVFCNADYDSIIRACRDVDWSFLHGKSFYVRVHRVLSSSANLSTRTLESMIGEVIYKSLNGSARVKFDSPEEIIVGVLSGGGFLLGVFLGESCRGDFHSRWVGNRPFIHPSSLTPIISRLFVNLCRARPGGLFFDPFCGFGGFLIEAALIGCEVVGLDIDIKMIMGCLSNLRYFNIKNYNLILGDAKHLPFKSVNFVATDPPYGRTASTKGMNLKSLIKCFLQDIYGLMSKDGYICIAAPENVDLKNIGLDVGFKLVESHVMRVHKSLIREVCVFKV